MRILVTGATCYVGSRLVTALLANRHQVVAATRNPERLKRFGWFDDVASVTLDASDPVSAQAAFASARDAAGPVDVVYYLVHAIGQAGFRDADKPVNALTDPHHLAHSDPAWAGGDALRIRRLARAITPPIARPTLRLVNSVPGPLAAALRTGLDILFTLTPKVRSA